MTDPAPASLFRIRPARPVDVRGIRDLVQPYADERILLAREWVGYYEAVQEFLVAEAPDGTLIGCGALHVMWQDLAEIRTLAVARHWRGRQVGHALLEALTGRARTLGLSRLFCLTFEVEFFAAHGWGPIDGTAVTPDVYAELLRSHDDGVAEFLDLARVKPNTLGNTRMLADLGPDAGLDPAADLGPDAGLDPAADLDPDLGPDPGLGPDAGPGPGSNLDLGPALGRDGTDT